MKLHHYLLSTALVASLAAGAVMAEEKAAAAKPESSAAAAAPAPKAMHHKKHRHGKHKDFFRGLNPQAKVQTIAEHGARFYEMHGFANAVSAFENQLNLAFRPDGPFSETYVVLYDNNATVQAHPDADMRQMNASYIEPVNNLVKECAWGNAASISYNWLDQHIVAHAIPVANGSYCVVARTVTGYGV